MTRRNHLMLDTIGQTCIILYYAFMLTNSSETIVLLQLFAISLCGWQFVNGILAYKFFEGQSKKLYVRVSVAIWVSIFGLFGILWLGLNLAFLAGLSGVMETLLLVFGAVEYGIWGVFPAVFGALACWYLYITIRDINVVINKTI